MSIRSVLDKTLAVTQLAITSAAIPGAQMPAVMQLMAKGLDLAQSAMTTDKEMGELLAWWQSHNVANKPMTMGVLKEKFDRAVDAALSRQSRFRAQYGLDPLPQSLEDLAKNRQSASTKTIV